MNRTTPADEPRTAVAILLWTYRRVVGSFFEPAVAMRRFRQLHRRPSCRYRRRIYVADDRPSRPSVTEWPSTRTVYRHARPGTNPPVRRLVRRSRSTVPRTSSFRRWIEIRVHLLPLRHPCDPPLPYRPPTSASVVLPVPSSLTLTPDRRQLIFGSGNYFFGAGCYFLIRNLFFYAGNYYTCIPLLYVVK